MRKFARYSDDSTDPALTISIDATTADDSRHRVFVERELRDHTYALLWDTAIGEMKATELYLIAERVADEYRVRTRFTLADLRVSPVAHPDPRTLAEVPQLDVAKELRHIVMRHPDDILLVHPGGMVLEHPHHGPYSFYVDSDGTYVAHPNTDTDTADENDAEVDR